LFLLLLVVNSDIFFLYIKIINTKIGKTSPPRKGEIFSFHGSFLGKHITKKWKAPPTAATTPRVFFSKSKRKN
jgi:hypothetical protein